MTWTDADARGGSVVLAIPLGATEQHGPHLPPCTDTQIAIALAEALARHRPDVVAAPAVAYGSSGEHADFYGTLSIGQAALEFLLIELCRSATVSFARVVVVCAHGGNAAVVRRAVARLRNESRDVRAWEPGWSGDAHAGRSETSLMLALAPDLVRTADAEPGERAPIADLLPRLRDGVRAVSANGVLGDPTGASAQEGALLLDAGTGQLVAFVDEWPV